MKRCKFYYFVAGICMSLFLVMAGCSNKTIEINEFVQSNPAVKLALTKSPGQSESYRLKTMSRRKVAIEGPARENAMDFQGGQTTNDIEIVFDSQVQSINSDGNAIEKITIKELKYVSEARGIIVLDFDSSKDKDPNDALAALIGQSYTIEVTPSGQVVKISDIDKIIGDIEDIPSNLKITRSLVSESNIELRHSVPLPDANDNEIEDGKTWSNSKNFNFDQMGSNSFERTYKLEKIIKVGENYKAVISMDAIPSVEGLGEIGSPSVPPMTDIRQTYTGSMELDINTGTLLKYQETLVNEWLIVPPGTGQDGPPSVLSMIATRSYDIEKIK